jgi:hypothetical protein
VITTPLPHTLDVVAIQSHDFPSSEAAGEGDEEQRPTMGGLHAIASGVQYSEQVLSQQRLGFAVGHPSRPLDAPQRGADDLGSAGVRQRPRLMRLRNRSDTSSDERGDAKHLCVRGKVGGHKRDSVGSVPPRLRNDPGPTARPWGAPSAMLASTRAATSFGTGGK